MPSYGTIYVSLSELRDLARQLVNRTGTDGVRLGKPIVFRDGRWRIDVARGTASEQEVASAIAALRSIQHQYIVDLDE